MISDEGLSIALSIVFRSLLYCRVGFCLYHDPHEKEKLHASEALCREEVRYES